MSAILVETTRGGLPGQGEHVENRHTGSVAVVDASGRLVASAGDPDALVFTRSTIKPFQALPFVLDGGPRLFGFAPRELAIMCSSHSGEPMHVEAVRAILERIGVPARALRCGCHVPLRFAAFGTTPAAGEAFTELEHNCSGKHAGFLGWCAMHGAPMDSYLEASHPLQQAIRERLMQVCDVPAGVMRSGVDGCSAPNYAIPLRCLALGYARLALSERGAHGASDAQKASDPQNELGAAQDGGERDNLGNTALAAALRELARAMLEFPELISGTGRHDLALMRAAPGDWIAKAGADGVQAIGIRSAGLGIAVKIADGNARAPTVAAISVLDALDLLDEARRDALASFAQPQILNARGLRVGEARAVLSLRKH